MMRIHFKDPKLTDGLIKVSLDGGYTFNEHNINDVKADGILLDESQDFDKIIVKGPANVLKNLDVLSKIQIDGDSIGNTGSSAEPVQEYYTDTWYAWEPLKGLKIYTKTLDVGVVNVFENTRDNTSTLLGEWEIINENTLKYTATHTKPPFTENYTRVPSADVITQFKKNAPIYVFDPELSHKYVTNEAEETPMEDTVDDGYRTTSLIINYDYLAKLFNVTDGRTIYFDTFHPNQPNYPGDRIANNGVYFYAINPEQIRYLSFDYNNNYKDGTYLFINCWFNFPEIEYNPDIIERVFTVNGEIALPEPIPSVVDPRFDNIKPVEDPVRPVGDTSVTEFTIQNIEDVIDWNFVNTIFPNLETIIVPEGVTEIPENFFYKEGGLTVNKIVLPKTISGILSKAFKGCTTTIEYAGSPNMWNAIDRVDDWDEDADINITYLMVDAVAPAPNM